MKKKYIAGSLTIILFLASIVLFSFLFIPHQKELTQFSVAHPVLAPLILIGVRFLGIVIPPISGGVVSFALIPILGWFWVYIYSSLGLFLGAIVAFLLARRYREPLVKRFVPLQDFVKWEGKLEGKTELWGFIILRMTTAPVMDFISYLAGLSKISFRTFVIATFISLLPSAPAYYFGGAALSKLSDESPYVGIGLFVLVGIIVFVYQKRNSSKRR